MVPGLLNLLEQDSPKLEMALMVERLFWQKWDYVRIKTYLTASKNFITFLRKVKNKLETQELLAQHRIMLELAKDTLPYNPFEKVRVETLVHQICQELTQTFENNVTDYLPALNMIVHKDGVYNPDLC